MNTPELLVPDRTLPEIDLSPVKIPVRSQLMSLVPHGLDTGDVESLWSYLHRLADAHSVRFKCLLTEHLSQYVRELLGSSRRAGESRGDWQNLVEAVHGVTFGTRVSRLLERLTGRKGLERLTLVPVCRTAGLEVRLRKDLAWCRVCLAEDSDPFARLIWTIAGVTHCPKHGTPLDTLCRDCGKPQRLFSGRSDILKCMWCGSPRNIFSDPELGIIPQNDDFAYWSSKQTGELLRWASRGELETRHIDVRTHNLRLSSQIPGIGGVVSLSTKLGLGRSTARTWIGQGGRMPLDSALKWAWIVGAELPRLFSEKLTLSELRFRPLPEELTRRTKPKRRTPVPNDTTALYLSTLKLSAANPFLAPRVRDLELASGTHAKHPSWKDAEFVRLIALLREKERRFLKKELVWRIVGDVNAAAIKAISINRRPGQGAVRPHMNSPGSLSGATARSYIKWLKRRYRTGDQSVLRPKRIPVDVRAFWSLEEAQD